MILPLLFALFQVPIDPFAPLRSDEIVRARNLILQESGKDPQVRFEWVAVCEPDKAEVLAGTPPARLIEATTFVPGQRRATEWILDLAAAKVVRRREVADVQPRVTDEEFTEATRIAAKDSRWRAALKKRGILDLTRVVVIVWGAGDVPEETGKRLVRLVPYRYAEDGNFLARPIEGLTALVDLSEKKILALEDVGYSPLPPSAPLPHPPAAEATQNGRPVGLLEEEGEYRWKRWRFRWDLRPREGLILRRVFFDNRSVLYRASLSEMAIPYGDPTSGWRWRSPIDVGEYGLGQTSAALLPGIDAPQNSLLFDAALATELGESKIYPSAVALYEQDGGLVYRHANIARRSRQLVLTHTATVGNYDYIFRWIFSEDGTLTNETELTGVMVTKGGAPHALGEALTAHPVSPSVSAVNHQHFFCWRLDLDVDGTANRLVECNTSPLPPGPENPEGNAIAMRETTLRTESEAKRRLDMAQSRYWKVVSEKGTAYALLPGANALPLAAPTASIRKRAGFLDAHLWATPNAPGEFYAAGDYPNQSAGGDGLTKWTKADRSLVNTDLVLWYVVGVTHLPRPEEWPIMGVHKVSFQLAPVGFFPRNPLLEK